MTNLPPCDRIRSCVNLDDDRRSASYSERRHGFGCGVSGASITHRWRAQSPSPCGGRMLQATNCVPAHAAPVAVRKARPFSVQAGPAIMSASIRSRPTSQMTSGSSIVDQMYEESPGGRGLAFYSLAQVDLAGATPKRPAMRCRSCGGSVRANSIWLSHKHSTFLALVNVRFRNCLHGPSAGRT